MPESGLPELTAAQWSLVVFSAFGLGVAKSGFAGIGLFHVVVFAFIFGAKKSTGYVLPMLLFGDVCAVLAYRLKHARWDYIKSMSLPTGIGVVIGWALMDRISESAYKPVIGSIILGLAAMQLSRMWRPDWFEHVPHAPWFAWSLCLIAGFCTMLANGAGGMIALYLVTVSMPKLEVVGTTAWFFLLLNLFKVPFSAQLGLIGAETLMLNAVLTPMIVFGLLAGRWLIHRIPQRQFDSLVLLLSSVAALRLIGVF
jgi:uncharacterized membrane protein YfcA